MNQVYPTKCMFSERKNVMDIDSIKVKGYKAFSEKYIEVDLKSNITVFIGRNNSGKSSCLDIIEGLTNASKFNELNVDNTLDYQVSCKLLEEDIKAVFPKEPGGGQLYYPESHYNYGKDFVGKNMWFQMTEKREMGYDRIYYIFQYQYIPNDEIYPERNQKKWKEFEQRPVNDFHNCLIRRISAERNIVPEIETEDENLSDVGNGASNLIRKFLNYSKYDENLVQNKVLEQLNCIIRPDANFNNIKIQQIDDQGTIKWEIFSGCAEVFFCRNESEGY